MVSVAELSFAQHGQLAISKDAALCYARRQHLLNLRVSEVSKTIGDLPVFFSRNSQSGQWLLSALCSFSPGQNLLVQHEQWQAGYQPVCMQSYPLLLVDNNQQPAAETRLALFNDEQAIVSATSDGQLLYEPDGQPTLFLSQQKALLEADLRHEYQTYQFIKVLTGLGLIKELDLQLLQPDGGMQTIKGLATVDEDKLQLLSGEQLKQLQQQGYLLVMHAMLLSISQLNRLIQLHNVRHNVSADLPESERQAGRGLLKSVRLELSRSQH